MAITKFQEALLVINNLEENYGSIVNAPESDPDFKKLRIIYPAVNRRDGRTVSQKINSLVNRGYQISYIASQLSLSKSYIYDYVNKNHMQFKQTFNWIIKSETGQVYYTTSLNHFLKICFCVQSHYSTSNARNYLLKRGFKVKKGSYVWCQIKTGSYFLLTNMDFPVLKKNKDSYVF